MAGTWFADRATVNRARALVSARTATEACVPGAAQRARTAMATVTAMSVKAEGTESGRSRDVIPEPGSVVVWVLLLVIYLWRMTCR